MITNDREYQIVKEAADHLVETLKHLHETSKDFHPLTQQAVREQREYEMAQLQQMMADYTSSQRPSDPSGEERAGG